MQGMEGWQRIGVTHVTEIQSISLRWKEMGPSPLTAKRKNWCGCGMGVSGLLQSNNYSVAVG